MTFQHAFQFLHDLAVAAHRAVEPLQVAIDDEDQVVELLAAAKRNGTERFRLVHLAVAHEGPDLASGGIGNAAPVQIFQEPRLVDRHQRPEPHRHGGELPEVGHQPGMRIRRQALAASLLSERQQRLFAEPSFHEGTRIDAGGGVTLHVDQIAPMIGRRRVPEMPEADIVEGCR
jgi:hypothetical protein